MNKLGKNANIEMQNKYIGKFKIKMTSPSTVQDKDRDDSFKQKLDSVKQFMDLIGSEDIVDVSTKKEIIKYFTSKMLNKQDIADLIEKDTLLEKQEEEQQKEDEDNNFEIDDGGHSSGGGGSSFAPDKPEPSGDFDEANDSDDSDLFDEE